VSIDNHDLPGGNFPVGGPFLAKSGVGVDEAKRIHLLATESI
jgi:hypothetical protein